VWGIVPAAGRGTRIQPLAFSKELLPVSESSNGSRQRPRAVSDYLVERLVLGGADRICFVIASGKSDILEYYGGKVRDATVCYTIQSEPRGLCDSIFCALPVVGRDEPVIVGLPDTVWFPSNALRRLPDDRLTFLLFPVERPEQFDSVVTDASDQVVRIDVKQSAPITNWIWGAFKMPASTLHQLHELWRLRGCADEYIGTLINAWIAEGGMAYAAREGRSYFDVGTMDGYVELMQALHIDGVKAKSLAS
jgi:glucose-1-phosphate thymidylyltransferase